ncbi:MAG: hypothetical protein NTY63_02995 [Candidatus Bipolaricaulota bacterium]|nr:hypothetical protein [Candidatus Bipolaricaulota bacterium]
MIHRTAVATAAVLVGLCAVGAAIHAGGISLGLEAYTLDMTGTWTQVPVAASAAFSEIEAMLSDQGVPAEELAEISADFDAAVADVQAALADLPVLVPVPLLALGVEISLPWVVIDGVRLSVGFLDDRFVRGVASGVAGIEIPEPLLDETLDVGDDTASLTADVAFSTWMISVDAVKRLDLVFLGADFSLGADVLWGSVTPSVEVDVPEEWEDGVDAALEALHLDEILWRAFGLHAGIGFELGLPFLRLYAEGRFVLSLGTSIGWWNLHVGTLAGALGMVIRF